MKKDKPIKKMDILPRQSRIFNFIICIALYIVPIAVSYLTQNYVSKPILLDIEIYNDQIESILTKIQSENSLHDSLINELSVLNQNYYDYIFKSNNNEEDIPLEYNNQYSFESVLSKEKALNDMFSQERLAYILVENLEIDVGQLENKLMQLSSTPPSMYGEQEEYKLLYTMLTKKLDKLANFKKLAVSKADDFNLNSTHLMLLEDEKSQSNEILMKLKSNLQTIKIYYYVSLIGITFVIFVIAFILQYRVGLKKEESKLQQDINNLRERIDDKGKDIFELMLENMYEMKEYYSISKTHVKSSFILSISFCVLGIILISIAVVVTFLLNESDTGIVSVIGGAISEVFAGTALLVHRSAVKQLNYYYKELHINEKYLSSLNVVSKMSKERQDDMYAKIIENSLNSDTDNLLATNNISINPT